MANLLSNTTIGGYQSIHTGNIGSYALPLSGGALTGQLYINNGDPTIFLQDTNHRSAMIHVNSNVFYVLRGTGTNSTGWSTYNGYWPLELNLENNNAQFGGSVSAPVGDFRAPIFFDSADTSYYLDLNGSSNLYNLTLTGAKQTYLTINPGNGYEAMVLYVGGSGSGWYVGKRMANQLVGTESFHFYSVAASQTVAGIDTGGNFFTTGYLTIAGTQLTGTQTQLLKNTLDVTTLPYKVDITVNGDANTFYAVQFWGGDQDVWRRIIIKRGYGETAPWDPIGTGVHHGGLLLDWEGNFGGWGGAEYADRIRVFNESYTNVCADMFIWSHAMGYVFMLRGGGAIYHLFSDQPINGFYQAGAPDIAYSTSTLLYDDTWSGTNQYDVPAPAPLTLAQVNSSRIDGLRTKKQSLLDNRYLRQGVDIGSITNISASNFMAANAFYLNGQSYYLNSYNGGIYTNARFQSAGSIYSDAYVYTNNSVRIGEIWSQGGIYRSSGIMLFGTENEGWRFSQANVQKVYIGTNGNIWMEWAGDYISNLLAAKQNASTAITTSNIGSQSVSYATTAGALSSMNISQFSNNSGYFVSSTANTVSVNQIAFSTTNYDFTLAPRLSIGSMSIKLWDNYFNSSGLGSDYGSLLDIYGRGGHVHSQFYMDANSTLYYRMAAYAGGWNGWQQMWTSTSLTNLSQLTNGPGYITSSALSGYATQSWVNSQGFLTSVPAQSQLISPNGATVVAADSAMPNAGHSFIHSLALGPGGNDGHILGMSWAGTTSVYGAQIFLDTDPNDIMAIRSRSNAGVWTSWKTVYHNGNFTDNSSNWNTAYSWGNHASAGYLTSLPSHNHDDRYYTESESDSRFLRSVYGDSGAYDLNVSGQHATIRFSTGVWANAPVAGNYSHVLSFNMASDNRTVQMYLGDVPGYLWWRPNQGGTWHPWERIWTSNNLTNLNQLSNGPGYITGYTETDTLATVTARGASTNGSIYVNGLLTGGLGAATTGGTLDWNDSSNARAGQGNTLLLGSHSNGPGPGEYFHPVGFEYASKNGGGNVTQLAISYGSPGDKMYMRGRYDGSWTGWTQFITSANIGSQSVNYAATAGSAPANGGNSSTVGGYSVSVGASANTIPTRNSSGYLIPESWIQLNGIYGLYSPTNGAHLRPNDGSYGSWMMTGSRNSWQGIEFNSGNSGNVTLMINVSSNTVGFHNNSYGWQFLWESGTLYCFKNAYGGGTQATVLDSSNYSSWAQPIASAINTGNIGSQSVSYATTAGTANAVAWGNVSSKPSNIMFYEGFTLNANTMSSNSTGFTYSVNAPFTGPIARFSTGGAYDLWLGGTYNGGGNAFYLRTRDGDAGSFNAWREIITSGNIGSQSVSYASSAGSVAWTNVSSRPTALSQFTNDLGNYGGFLTSITAHSHAISDVSGLQTALDGKQASLGFTPYNATNPSGYITSSASISGNAATATIASTVTVNSGNSSAAWYPIVWHSGNTVYSSGVEIYAAGNYIRSQYINTTDNDESGITRFVIKNGDSYHRSATTTVAADIIRGVASGSWGINVTGSAGSVAWTNVSSRPTALSQFSNDLGNYGGWITSSGSISGSAGSVTGLTLTSSANGINPDNVTQNQIGYNTSVSLFGQTDGGLYSSAYSSSWIHQIYGDFRTGQIAIRGKNSGSWQAWRTVLDSSNYTSYAPGLTGSGASGTWGISVTGNAATVGGYAPSGSVGANTVVIRDANNYIYAHYINSNVSESENPTINSFYTSNGDGWLRKSSVAHVKSQLGLGSMAYESSGTYQTVSGAINTGNIGSQSVSYATTSQQLTKFGDIYGQDWNSYYINGKMIVSSVYGGSGPNFPTGAYNYGAMLSYGVTGSDFFQVYFPENGALQGGAFRKLHYRTGWNGSWSAWKSVVDQEGQVCTIAGSNQTGIEIHSNVGYNQDPLTYFLMRGQADTSWKALKVRLTGDAGGQDIEFRRIAENGADARMWYIPRGANTVNFDYPIVQPSDSRLKDNITPISTPVDKIKSLRGVEFDWNSGEQVGTHDVGLIAQDVEAVLPEAVTTQEDGYKNLAYAKVIPLLVEAMKEQQAMIEALKAEIELLKNR